jgi:tetratricopeptide (TPR) repeat protein
MSRALSVPSLAVLTMLAAAAFAAAVPAAAQDISLPPSGDNQKCSITQHIGLATVTVDYSSPDVHAPDGSDRHGKIWGTLIPYGYHEENFGTCGKKCPWRGGANENTVVRFSHDVTVEGKPLAAGAYGLHFLAGQPEWTVIFSKNSTSWGSFRYDEAEDALRVTVKSETAPYREWLAYDFIDRSTDHAVLALEWEDLRVPIAIAVPQTAELYYQTISGELRSSPGFDWHSWQQGADYLVQAKIHLDVAERWAQNAVSLPFIGKEEFDSLHTLSTVQKALGKDAESQATMAKALALPSTGPFDIYGYARPMIKDGKAQEALKIFQDAAKRMPGQWPLDLGIARAESALGHYPVALKYAKSALTVAPDDPNRDNVKRMIAKLEKGEDMNK